MGRWQVERIQDLDQKQVDLDLDVVARQRPTPFGRAEADVLEGAVRLVAAALVHDHYR